MAGDDLNAYIRETEDGITFQLFDPRTHQRMSASTGRPLSFSIGSSSAFVVRGSEPHVPPWELVDIGRIPFLPVTAD